MPSPAAPIKIEIRKVGHIPAFKNKKRLGKSPSGQSILFTRSDVKQLMEEASRSIELQLRSVFQTSATGISTGCSLRCWMRTSLPLDDSRQWIVSETVNFVVVEKGDEGADILIEKIR